MASALLTTVACLVAGRVKQVQPRLPAPPATSSSQQLTPGLLRQLARITITQNEQGDWLIANAQRQQLLAPAEEQAVTTAVKEHGQWRDVHEQLAEQLGRQPTRDDLSQALGFPDDSEFDERVRSQEQALQSIVQCNLRLVVSLARPFRNRGVPMQDLIQEGTMGLMIAARKFDPTRGYKFSTYATHWIRQSIRRAIMNDARPIRIPAYLQSRVNNIRRARARAYYDTGENPSKDELSAIVELDGAKLRRALEAESTLYRTPLSLDETINGFEIPRMSLIADESNVPWGDLQAADASTVLSDLLVDVLDNTEREILSLRYGLNNQQQHSCKEIGEILNLSVKRVRNISHRGIRKLRQAVCDPEVEQKIRTVELLS